MSNPSVVSTVSLLASLEIFQKTTMEDLRSTSLRLTAYLYKLIEQRVLPTFGSRVEIITPVNPLRRGCQLSILFRGEGLMERVFHRLCMMGVLTDERKPNVIRISPAPLYCTFRDVWRCVEMLALALEITE